MADRFIPRSLSHKPNKTYPRQKIKKHIPQTTNPGSFELCTIQSNDWKEENCAIVRGTGNSKKKSLGDIDVSGQSTVRHIDEKDEEVESDNDEVVYFSKNQRWPDEDEPICVVCGRYGEYICDQTEDDVCSKECKAKNLKLKRQTEKSKIKKEAEDSNLASLNEYKERLKNVDQHTHSSDVFTTEDIWEAYSYTVHPEVASLSESQVSELCSRMEITVKGDRIQRPILEFSHCNLDAKLLENLSNFGYKTPTPVQMQVIPVALGGSDVLACAQTGSGKTAAFVVPMITKIHHGMVAQPSEATMSSSPKGLVLAPTRELCMQIEKQAKELMTGLPHMKTALIVGGLPLPNQLHRLRQGVQIVFATPGRLAELMDKTTDIDFSEVRMLVIDEVDVLMQMGFEKQIQAILEHIPIKRQTLLFSATIPSTVEKVSSSLLSKPVWISVGAPSAPNMAVKQIVLWVDDKSKKKRLFSLLQDYKYFTPPILVFVDSKMGADLLAEAIQKTCNIHCTSMHGDKAQSERTRILESFLAGVYDVLVCTGVMGRGLDLQCVKQVINFDMPSSVDEYIHQVGRAGRLGSQGLALTFINNTNKNVFLDLMEAVGTHGVKLPQELINSPYLVQQKYTREHGKKGCKRKSEETYVNRDNLMDMLKKSTFRRRLKNR